MIRAIQRWWFAQLNLGICLRCGTMDGYISRHYCHDCSVIRYKARRERIEARWRELFGGRG